VSYEQSENIVEMIVLHEKCVTDSVL